MELAVLLTAETGVHLSENCLENEKLVKKAKTPVKPLTIRERQPCWSTVNTQIKGNAVCAYLNLFFFFLYLFYFTPLRLLVTWCYLWCLWMHDHIYLMDWLIKDILRLLFSFIVMCLSTCLFQLVRWSVQVFIERTNEFDDVCIMLSRIYTVSDGLRIVKSRVLNPFIRKLK